MPLTFGTSYFVSKETALRYYNFGEQTTMNEIDAMLTEGLIHIGKPPTLKPGESLVLLDDGARYGIREAGR